jgi:hypothetical protein
MHIAFHCNPAQPHQREHAEWLSAGCQRHGLSLSVTPDRHVVADIHIVSGPHYAKSVWLDHPAVLWLDRSYYHEEKSGRWKSMDWVSLGWLRADGARVFESGAGRAPPSVEDRPENGGTIFLADYGGPVETADTVRRHPADEPPREGLREALRRHRIAIGYQTTALVAAALAGLEIICKDPRNILWQPNWLELLPYADWHWTEIESGSAWGHLMQHFGNKKG